MAITSSTPMPEVERRGRHIAMHELPLENRQRHSLSGELNSVGMSQLVGRKASPDAGVGGEVPEFGADGGA